MNEAGPQPLFVAAGLLVSDAQLDVGVGGVRARLARDLEGELHVVEDLEQRCLEDEHQRTQFRTELAMRVDACGARARHVSGVPMSATALVPGVPFERVFRARIANSGSAPHGVVVEAALAAIAALQPFALAPVAPDDVAMLVWAGFDGSLSPSPRIARVAPRTNYDAPDRRTGPRDDVMLVYSLGIFMHCLLHGEPEARPRPVAPANQTPLWRVIVACLAPSRGDRPQSLDEVRRSLMAMRVDARDELVATLFAHERDEQAALAEQVRMLPMDDVIAAAPVLRSQTLALRDERAWLAGGARPASDNRRWIALP